MMERKFKKVLLNLIMWLAVFSADIAASTHVLTSEDVEINTEGCITKYIGTATDIIIPSTIGEETITAIGRSSFESKGLTNVILPDSIITIEEYAFDDNWDLGRISLPSKDGHVWLRHDYFGPEQVTEFEPMYGDRYTLVDTSTVYSITYVLNGGTNSTSNKTSYGFGDDDIFLSAPSKFGWEFIGWFDEATPNDIEDKITTISSSSFKDITLYAIYAQVPYSGSGTALSPYKIGSLDELRYLSENFHQWDKHFILTADIDASETTTWNSYDDDRNPTTPDIYRGFSPIGKGGSHFIGSFDGKGYKVSNVYMIGPGFFGITSGSASIRNLTLVNIYVRHDGMDVGGLVGYCSRAIIKNCHVISCDIKGARFVGGLIGRLYSPNVSFCSVEGGTIEAVGYSSPAGYGAEVAGGLVGWLLNEISNCYANATTIAPSKAGGLVGEIANNSRTKIINCHSVGAPATITGNVRYGTTEEETIINSFFLSSGSSSTYGTPYSPSQMATESNFIDAGWSFTKPKEFNWELVNDEYPTFIPTYSINYILDDDATNSPENPTIFFPNSPTITLSAPSKPGFTFTGWKKKSLTRSQEIVTEIPTGTESNITLVAQWTGTSVYTYGSPNTISGFNTDHPDYKTAEQGGMGDVTLPSINEFDGTTITAIAPESFRLTFNRTEGHKMDTVVIPNTVTSIGAFAFFANTLTSVVLPKDITMIDDRVFAYNNLSSLTIPDKVETIGYRAFDGNMLTTVSFPDSVTSIGTRAFLSNQLTSLTVPDTLTSVGDWAFAFNKISSLNIEEGVSTIGKGMFEGNHLQEISLPNTITTISDWAFANNLLSHITLPSSVTSLGAQTFNSMDNSGSSHNQRQAINRIDFEGDNAAIVSDWVATQTYYNAKDGTIYELNTPKTVAKGTYVTEVITISFLAGGGNGTMAEQKLGINYGVALNKNLFSRSGYTFNGWLDSENTNYYDEQVVTLSSDITLTAQWEVISAGLLDVDEDGNITERDDIDLINDYVIKINAGIPESVIETTLLQNFTGTNPKNLNASQIIDNIKKVMPFLDIDEDDNITERDDIDLINDYVVKVNAGIPESVIETTLLQNFTGTNPNGLTAAQIITNIKKLL